ncbi:MAG: Zn-ribbon containing protein [Candidatus Woesearchaeota archaeon]
MPHQCVSCGTLYDDGSKEILKGCKCGGKLFFFIKKEKLAQVQAEIQKLSQNEKEQIQEDVYDIIGSQIDTEKPVVLEFESIKILQPGKYELDLVKLFKNQPLVFKLEEGKYMIDLIQTFKSIGTKKKKK